MGTELKNKILAICPSRNRPNNVRDLIKTWLKTTAGLSELVFYLDDNDPNLSQYKQFSHPSIHWIVGPQLGFAKSLNEVYERFSGYKVYGFVGDDVRFRTDWWDKIVFDTIEKEGKGWGIVYGNDLIMKERLPTHPFITSNILNVVKVMALPETKHLYVDNLWQSIGEGIGKLFYLPDLILEHMHFSAKKSPMDAVYSYANAPKRYEEDGAVYNNFVKEKKDDYIKQIRSTMIEDLIKRIPVGHYQDVEFQGKLYKGQRDCQGRWDLIKDYVKEGTILDIGSSQGYFVNRFSDNKNNLVVSIESDKISCEIQKMILNGKKNIVICESVLTEQKLKEWTQVVEFFDTVLALSILHHFKDPEKIVAYLASLSPILIAEIPSTEETEAYNQSAVKQLSNGDLFKKHYEHVEILGYVDSHLGKNRRPLFLCSNNSIERKGLHSYLGVEYPNMPTYDVKYHNEKWFMGNKELISGVNAWNLLKLNVVYPDRKWWMEETRRAYSEHEQKSDVRPWNLLVTNSGLKAIDLIDPKWPGAGYNPDDMEKTLSVFERMEPQYG